MPHINLLIPPQKPRMYEGKRQIMSMTKEAVREKMNDPNTVVLDVLSEDDYNKLHIKGSDCFTFGQNVRSFLLAVEKKYGKGKFIITYCASLADALSRHNAAVVLKEQGFEAEDYPGGILEWSEAGFPTEGTEAKSLAAMDSTQPPTPK
jgi:rhodanese-related sulfurtransferase